MSSPLATASVLCRKCGAPVDETERYCPDCGTDVGAPNVRRCTSAGELAALLRRSEDARELAARNGCGREYDDLLRYVLAVSSVVVALPAFRARELFSDGKSVYQNYETLVGARVRKPASFANDSHRRVVGGALFASYADQIVYGMLSLTDDGLATYGDVFCRLKPAAVDNRVSFLEENSYNFVEKHKASPSTPLPEGYRATWENRHLLVGLKLAPMLKPGMGPAEWQRLLLHSDSTNRGTDEFVEAHLFGGFTAHSVEQIKIAPKNMSREQKVDAKLASEHFKRSR